jgi:hypothetical protein
MHALPIRIHASALEETQRSPQASSLVLRRTRHPEHPTPCILTRRRTHKETAGIERGPWTPPWRCFQPASQRNRTTCTEPLGAPLSWFSTFLTCCFPPPVPRLGLCMWRKGRQPPSSTPCHCSPPCPRAYSSQEVRADLGSDRRDIAAVATSTSPRASRSVLPPQSIEQAADRLTFRRSDPRGQRTARITPVLEPGADGLG